MKILNLYAGIGGNRKLWGDEHEVTALEMCPETAKTYKDNFPNDHVIVSDAHDFLLKNYKEFDFIWSSPPCPTHSTLVFSNENIFYDRKDMKYPDMTLYQEIILLKKFIPENSLFIVENVKSYYDPLINPDRYFDRHYFWCNFNIEKFYKNDDRKHDSIKGLGSVYGFDISESRIKDKRKALRNMVDPELGLHILNCALGKKMEFNSEQITLF